MPDIRDILDSVVRASTPNFDRPKSARPERAVIRLWYPGSNAVAEVDMTFPKEERPEKRDV